jgi:hypothetical protein
MCVHAVSVKNCLRAKAPLEKEALQPNWLSTTTKRRGCSHKLHNESHSVSVCSAEESAERVSLVSARSQLFYYDSRGHQAPIKRPPFVLIKVSLNGITLYTPRPKSRSIHSCDLFPLYCAYIHGPIMRRCNGTCGSLGIKQCWCHVIDPPARTHRGWIHQRIDPLFYCLSASERVSAPRRLSLICREM